MRAYGFEGRTERTPFGLVRQGRRILETAAQPSFKLPPSRMPGVEITPEVARGQLEEPLVNLEEVLAGLRGEEDEAEATMLAKNQAFAENDRIFLGVAQMVEACARLAEEEELAERIRPSERRPGQTESHADEPAEPSAETPPAETPAA